MPCGRRERKIGAEQGRILAVRFARKVCRLHARAPPPPTPPPVVHARTPSLRRGFLHVRCMGRPYRGRVMCSRRPPPPPTAPSTASDSPALRGPAGPDMSMREAPVQAGVLAPAQGSGRVPDGPDALAHGRGAVHRPAGAGGLSVHGSIVGPVESLYRSRAGGRRCPPYAEAPQGF